MLSDENRAYRRGKMTASLARELMNADTDERMLALYDQAIDETPVTETYAMRAGAAMEPVIQREYELRFGTALTRVQEIVDHPTIKDFMATLDGFDQQRGRVVEIKCASPFLSRDELHRMFYPQVAFQMACADVAEGLLFVGQGTNEPIEIDIMRDPFDYEPEMLSRCEAFQLCVKTLTPPTARPIVVPPEKWRTVDISRDAVNWGSDLIDALADYEATADAALAHAAANKVARDLIPDDVGKVIAGPYTLSRNKKGIISIRRAA